MKEALTLVPRTLETIPKQDSLLANSAFMSFKDVRGTATERSFTMCGGLGSLIGKHTRRLHGRRAITPMKSKGKKVAIKKTRCHHKVETHVQLPKHTSPRNVHERSPPSENQHCLHQERKGNKDSGGEGKREDTEEHQETITQGSQSDSECTIHPGSLQE
jgi:hypothetical protein